MLPPVSTQGLTAADVSALAARVHEQMVAALREISVPLLSPNVSSEDKPSLIPPEESNQPPTDPLSGSAASVFPVEPDPTQAASSAPESRSESRASTQTSEESSNRGSRLDGSENGTETEEDDGMVLVGRPK